MGEPAFVERLRALIGKDTIESWAKCHGLTAAQLRHILYRRTLPTTQVLTKIARQSGVDLNWLLLGENRTPTPAGVKYRLYSEPHGVPIRVSTPASRAVAGEQYTIWSARKLEQRGLDPRQLEVVAIDGAAVPGWAHHGDELLILANDPRPLEPVFGMFAVHQDGYWQIIETQRFDGENHRLAVRRHPLYDFKEVPVEGFLVDAARVHTLVGMRCVSANELGLQADIVDVPMSADRVHQVWAALGRRTANQRREHLAA